MDDKIRIRIDFNDLPAMRRVMDEYSTTAMLVCENDKGEKTTISIFEDSIVRVTYQANHWIRKDVLYRDGEIEKMYEGKWGE